jgi:glutamine phosphoribosylpyrophosphate amidotransferase
MLAGMNSHRSQFCTSCYTGRYPVPFPKEQAAALQLPLRLVPSPAKDPAP